MERIKELFVVKQERHSCHRTACSSGGICATSPSQSISRCSSRLRLPPAACHAEPPESSSLWHTEARAGFLICASQIWLSGHRKIQTSLGFHSNNKLTPAARVTPPSGERSLQDGKVSPFAKIRAQIKLLLAKLRLKHFPSSSAAAIRSSLGERLVMRCK